MQSPMTRFKWYDSSDIANEVTELIVKPLFIAAASTDKGPEDMREVEGDDFYKLYGTEVSFTRHGQPLLSVARSINAGARVLFKRLVSNDATLANAIVLVNVTSTQAQKVNAAGQPLYLDVDGNETIDSSAGEAVMVNKAVLSYDVQSAAGVKTLEEVKTYANSLYVEGETIPLFVIVDNGRGSSTKKFNIVPDYTISKSATYPMYYFNVVGEYKDIDSEYVRFTLDDTLIYLGKSMSLSMTGQDLKQVVTYAIPDAGNELMQVISDITGADLDTIEDMDVLFGCDRKGNASNIITVDIENGYDLTSELGIELLGGTDGTFGTTPIASTEYEERMLEFWKGDYTDNIWDVDRWKIYACIDANYSYDVKNAIIDLADFREDFFFFADMGLEVDTFDLIKDKQQEITYSKFCALYPQYFDVVDEFNKKQITVTGVYPLSKYLVYHYMEQEGVPACGIAHGFTFDEVIPDTINFVPKYTPYVDQKTEMCELFLNYGTYVNSGVYTLETEFTHQAPFTQLSFINNIIMVQGVIRAVREACPRYRYTFITNDDLEQYKTAVENVLSQFAGLFDSLQFEYVQDDIMAANKIFQANINVTFKDFIQSELFNIYTLN